MRQPCMKLVLYLRKAAKSLSPFLTASLLLKRNSPHLRAIWLVHLFFNFIPSKNNVFLFNFKLSCNGL